MSLKCFEDATYFENIGCHYDDGYFHDHLYNDMKRNKRVEKTNPNLRFRESSSSFLKFIYNYILLFPAIIIYFKNKSKITWSA